jgi:peptide/nickel transport system substrate-binding protein
MAVIGLLVTACGTSTASTAPSAAASAAASTAASAAASTAASAAASTAASAAASGSAGASAAASGGGTGNLAEVPRNQTFIFSPWGFVSEIPNPDNWNIYASTSYNHQREMGLKGIYEALFYTNLNTGELIPWQGESYTYNADFTQITLKLRDGITWCDGEKFTADDVKYTLEMLRDNSPDLLYSSVYKEYLKDVTVVDPLTAQINLTKPSPRFFRDNLALGHENHQVILPKHIWASQDPKTFKNFDVAKNWPCGTGPYHIVQSTAQQQIADEYDKWWGTTTGFQKALPAPKRLILIPVASDQAMAQLHLANSIDYGNPLQPGTFVGAQAQNPKLTSWSPTGPVWGAPDGCGYNFVFNNLKAPWTDVNIRTAINYAIDRQKISDIGYEGANYPEIVPFSAYMTPKWVPKGGPLQAVIDKYDRGTPSQAKVDEFMGKAGYAKNSDGKWAKDGTVLKVPVYGPSFFGPLAPPLTQMLNDAGFDAAQQFDEKYDTNVLPGNADTWFLVHCGSLSEPYDTLKDLNSKFSRPIGTALPNIIAGTRYSNPEMDAVLNKMDAIPADPDPNSEYMKLAVQATDIYLRDVPEIMLTEELHVVTANNTYWTGFMNKADPYAAPYPCWEAFYMAMFKLKPTGA